MIFYFGKTILYDLTRKFKNAAKAIYARTATGMTSSSASTALDSINSSLAELCAPHYHHCSFDVPRRFSGFAQRLQLALSQLTRSTSSLDAFPPSVLTALRGIAAELGEALKTVSCYRTKGKIFVLINCISLCKSINEKTVAISGWLALLDSAIEDLPDLRKKIADLSRDMKQTQFKVSEVVQRLLIPHCLQVSSKLNLKN